MAKSKPIGVRFDVRILEKYPNLSPQKILNKLSDMDLAETVPDEIQPVTVTPLKFKVGDQPIKKIERLPGESSLDYRIRCLG